MAGMGKTCNHVAAAMYCVEAVVRIGLTNPACTSNQSLPNEKAVEPKKVKDLHFSREDFGRRGRKKRPLVASPKEWFDPLKNCDLKPFSMKNFF